MQWQWLKRESESLFINFSLILLYSLEQIKEKWKWIMERLYPQLSKDVQDRPQMLKFLVDKFMAKAEDEEQEEEISNANFWELFKLPNETLITCKFPSFPFFFFFCWIKRG